MIAHHANDWSQLGAGMPDGIDRPCPTTLSQIRIVVKIAGNNNQPDTAKLTDRLKQLKFLSNDFTEQAIAGPLFPPLEVTDEYHGTVLR